MKGARRRTVRDFEVVRWTLLELHRGCRLNERERAHVAAAIEMVSERLDEAREEVEATTRWVGKVAS